VLPAALFVALALAAGYTVLRQLGLLKGFIGIGLAPSLGLALLAVVTTWSDSLGTPILVSTLLVTALGAGGLIMAARDWPTVCWASVHGPSQRLVWGTVGLATALPILVTGTAIGAIQAPLSTDDGAFHVEIVHTLRTGQPWVTWYPPGLHTAFAAVLQLLPWLDSAQGVFEIALALTILAPLAVFALGLSIWRHAPFAAAAAALLTASSFLFPYGLQLWGGWPLAAAIVLVLGLWTAAIEYLHAPSWRWAGLAGVFAGAVFIVHSTELYTGAIGLAVFGLAGWKRIPWRRLPQDLLVAGLVAVAIGVPYVPTLFSWAGAGGATSVGTGQATAVAASLERTGPLYEVQGVLMQVFDLDPITRLVLVPAGIWWAWRAGEGRSLIVLATVFFALIGVFTFASFPPVQAVYAALYPWAQNYHLLYIGIIATRLIEGGGCCAIGLVWVRAQERFAGWISGHRVAARRARRAAVVLLGAWLVVSAASLIWLLRVSAGKVDTVSSDDAAAMEWLRSHAQAAELVANDKFADAGIWAPQKAGIDVVWPRVLPTVADPHDRELVLANVGQLESVPEAAAAACRLHVRYVYRGASGTRWVERHFPPLAELRQSTALEEAFSSGDAAVFRVRPTCQGERTATATFFLQASAAKDYH
jgi:hypothetical protein